MKMKLELVMVPVSDPDRSIEFYRDKVGFHLDHDHKVSPEIRFIQMTPPGSACSIAFGKGINPMQPGEQKGLQVVVDDVEEAKAHLDKAGVETTGIDDMPWGRFVFFRDPDGNAWTVQQIPKRD